MIMACHLFMAWHWTGDKPLSEPMLPYCQLDPLDWNLNQNTTIFIEENSFENVMRKVAAILSQPQYANSSPPSAA